MAGKGKKRKRKKKLNRASKSSGGHIQGIVSEEQVSESFPKEKDTVKQLIRKGKSKSALELAKNTHKRHKSVESEALLVEVYVARIEEMLENNLFIEAKNLLELVWGKYPSYRIRLNEVKNILAVRQGRLDDLIRPLENPDLPSEERGAVERLLKAELTDPSYLADCDALSPDHPLRTAAGSVVAAFKAVTSGPVDDDAILLPEVSRRSPLAPWKMMIRAIAAFYRDDYSTCNRHLDRIESDSIPARMIPTLRSMMSKQEIEGNLTPEAASLVKQVLGNVNDLRRSIRDLDKALDDEENRKILSSTRTVIDNCKKYRPKLLDRMRQHIAIRAFPAHLTAGQIIKAMGGAPVKDAYFFRLSARFMEFTQGFVTSVRLWDEFRKHAVQEGWFGAESLESASLYLHMAELICRCPKEEIESEREFYEADFEDYDFLYGGQPALDRQAIDHGDSDDYFLYPDALFERANQIDPDPEIFKQWLDWQRDTDDTWKATDRIALAWHEAFPRDTRPLLFLMESAEKRNALEKSDGLYRKGGKY